MDDVNTNPLCIDYGLCFDKEQISDRDLRQKINSVHRKMRAINVIAAILQASEVERDSQDDPECLTSIQSFGFYDALIELSRDGTDQSEQIGIRLTKIKGAEIPEPPEEKCTMTTADRTQSRADSIQDLVEQANRLSLMLGDVDALPLADQQSALDACSDLALETSGDVDNFIRSKGGAR